MEDGLPSSQQATPASGPAVASQVQAYIDRTIAHQLQTHSQHLLQQIQHMMLQQRAPAQGGPVEPHPIPGASPHAHGSGVSPVDARLVRSLRPSDFTGHAEENPAIWALQVNTYFDLAGVASDAVRIRSTGMFLKRAALEWWAAYSEANKHDIDAGKMAWEQFLQALKDRFRPVDMARIARSKLYTLRQRDCKNLAEYNEKFQRWMEHIVDMNPADQVDRYRYGLMPSLQRELAHKDPKTLTDIMSAATRVDIVDRQVNPQFTRPRGYVPYASSPAVPHRPSGIATASGSSSTSTPMELGNVTQERVPGLSKEDYHRLREENKCFRCRRPGHVARRCPNKSRAAGGERVNALEEPEDDESLNSSPQ
jgi:hypothetical protein